MIKTNFKTSRIGKSDINETDVTHENENKKELTQAEFEEFIIKSGASGSFMVFRSDKPDDELGLEEL